MIGFIKNVPLSHVGWVTLISFAAVATNQVIDGQYVGALGWAIAAVHVYAISVKTRKSDIQTHIMAHCLQVGALDKPYFDLYLQYLQGYRDADH